MIFKLKYNFVILELIGQPYCDLEWNNSKNVWNKCLKDHYFIKTSAFEMKIWTI